MKNAFRGILKNAAIFLLGATKSFDRFFVSLRLIDLCRCHLSLRFFFEGRSLRWDKATRAKPVQMELRPTEMQELPEHWGPNIAFGMPIPMNSVGNRPAGQHGIDPGVGPSGSKSNLPPRQRGDYRLRLSEDFWVGVRNG